MLRINEGTDAARLLGLGDGMGGEGGFAGALRTVDLHNASAGETAYTESNVE